MEKAQETKKKVLTGVVTSDKMAKTIVVQITTKKLHPLYKKYITSSVKYKAHDEINDAKIGDKVSIVECRPISKDKCWSLQEILERAK
jgi:small subunit ribosomal protein S17